MKSTNPDSERARAIALEKELDDLLKRRSDLSVERNGLLRRAQEEESERPESLSSAEMRAGAEAVDEKIASINAGLRPLKKRIQDACNAASRNEVLRVALAALLKRVKDSLLSFSTEGEIDLSSWRERDVRMKLANAKTNSTKIKCGAELARIELHRSLVEQQRSSEKQSEAHTPDSLVVKYGTYTKESEGAASAEATEEHRKYLKAYTVFHASQVEGITFPEPENVPELPANAACDRARAMVAGMPKAPAIHLVSSSRSSTIGNL